ncbi:TMV resistance protein N-like isoform X2 [Cryptomeria japonica]|uniref:TMV resistance protein N-like isoform X2 n=1 Tax=Cryptomeria japonica TaxID=3369 RepID=UPI0027D9D895|nr:TMV resistance protein N-like isoform X2 [Cryptomeria japonica]
MASCSSPPTLTEVKKCFADVDSTALNEFIDTIKKILETKMASNYEIDNPSTSFESTNEWNLLILSGKTFWCFLDPQEQFGQTVDLFQSRTQVLSVISSILEGLGQIHWAVAGLSMIGYLLKKVGPLSNNRDDCLQLLQYMLDIVYHMNKLRRLFPEEKEKLKSALVIIVKGSMLCAKQLSCNAHFSYLKVSLDSTSLSSLLSEMNAFYRDFLLTTQIAALEGQPQRMPIKKPDSTANEERYTEVENLLDMEPKDLSFRAVIIYGLGGIGKTFIANAVYSRLNLDSYNHTRIVMDTDPQKNDIKKMQEQILNDAFPQYNSRKIKLRNEQEGRELLTEAFKETNKPVFLFIDNALRSDDLKKLLPEHLELSGKNIRLLLTTRNLNAMYMFRKRFRHEYLVKPLLKSDAEKILWNGTNNPPLDTGDFVRILKICNGVPLVLQIVGAHLENQEYKVENCSLILNALKKGDEIKENKLSECLVDLVFKELDKPIQEAFLDICCFLDGESRRRVEFVVGAMELKALEGAALIAYKPEKEIVVLDPLIKARGQNMAQSTRITDIKSFETAVEEKRLQNIKGISLSGNRGSDYELKTEDLDSMSKTLRVFILKRTSTGRKFQNK